MEPAYVELRVFARRLRKTFRNHRAPATFPLRKTNLVSGCFEQLDGGLPDVGIVVVNERIVEKDNLTIGNLRCRISNFRFIALRKPGFKSFCRKERQLAARIDSYKSIQGAPDG